MGFSAAMENLNNAMIIDEILDMMDDLLDSGASVPFSVKKIVIDGDNMRECINKIRLNLPSEIKEARNIALDKKIILSDANKEAEQIVRRAEERSKALVSNDEITKAAKQRAIEILNQAQSESKKVKNAANKYIEDTLLKSEESLQASLSDIKRTRQSVKNSSSQIKK